MLQLKIASASTARSRKLPEKQISYTRIETKPPKPRLVSVVSQPVFGSHDMFAFEQYAKKVCEEAKDQALADRFMKVGREIMNHGKSLKRRKR
jgi:hypothetical protein